ncbi:hypothetical protein Daus18300_010888 [Diaporthe australafricana]|uniref:Uncharacterized protein n=1 Tax=Diaporthe australafricana TaxID=127596 RepID=A0ABR3W8X9_9PEZI
MSSSQARPPPGVDPIKFARRGIGRSPEEHAALERVLAERRRRRGATANGSGSSSRRRSRSPAARLAEEQADLARQRWALEDREWQFKQRREFAWRQLERVSWLEEQQRDLNRREEELEAQGRQLSALPPIRRVAAGLVVEDAEIDAGQALLTLPIPQRRAEMLAPFGVTGARRRAKGKSKGAGWHKRGYRDDMGDMWINVKEGDICTKGQDVSEKATLADFVRQVQREFKSPVSNSANVNHSLSYLSFTGSQEESDHGCQAQKGYLTWDLLFRKKSLRKLPTDLANVGLEEDDVLVRDLLDGGETVYYRLFDEQGVYVRDVYQV